MATTESLYVISESGAERWDITKRPIQVQETIVEAFSQNLTRKNPAVLKIGGDYGNAGIAMASGYEVWSVRVLTLGLAAPFALKDGVHTPVFDSKSLPALPLKWKPPESMVLVLGISVFADHTAKKPYYIGDHYLVAFDKDKRMWRMPVSNLYADCKLCHGQDAKQHETALEAATMACEMFSRSRWNADLYDKTAQPRTDALFRFKPTESDFEQLPPVLASGKTWTSLCEKVAVEKLNQLIQCV